MMTPPPPELVLYSRADCHLCEQMKGIVQQVATEYPVRLKEIDIDADPALRERYNEEVPVLFVDGRKAFKYRVTARELRARLRQRTRPS